MLEADMNYKDLLIKFGEGRPKVCIRFDPKDPFTKNYLFKRGHREMIEHLFMSEYKMKVIKHAHTYDHTVERPTVLEPGLIYAASDSEIHPMVEVWGIVGVSVVPVGEA